MTLWIDIIFAWIALILAFFLAVIWALRLIHKKKKIPVIMKINRTLRRHHKLTGILMIAAALVHGLFSSTDVLSINLGTISWVVSIMLGLNWMLRKKLEMKKTWMRYHRLLTVLLVFLVVIHIIDVGGFILDDMILGDIAQPAPITQTIQEEDEIAQNTPTPTIAPTPTETSASEATPTETTESETTPTPTVSTPESTVARIYQDGVYEGVGEGFMPGLTVEVVIEKDIITSVTVTDHNEVNKKFWGYPVEVIPGMIVEAQSTDVDSISGATYTSRGIKEAVDDALSQALIE